jgi:hypothetical protein
VGNGDDDDLIGVVLIDQAVRIIPNANETVVVVESRE